MAPPVSPACKGDDMADFIRPDQPSRCTWHVGVDPKTTPHSVHPYQPRAKILPNILHAIGHTPMVRLNKIPQAHGIKCEMLAKCEYFNPGGSVKDRIGYRMVVDAEEKWLLKPGDTLIEPTSGNTGIGIAMASAVKGYRCIIVMPEKMSNEKVDALRCLGAEIIRTPTAAAFDSPEGLIAVAQRLHREIPGSHVLDQYRNPGNPLAHYDLTAEEIVDQCGGRLDMVVLGAGTGGTVAGVGRKIKEICPGCQVVAIDPLGSVLAEPPELNVTDVNYYEVEGIGYDFIPTVLDRKVVDKWVKTDDSESLPMARRLIREEGLFCGGSSGSAMAGALKAAASLTEGQRCVVLLPDGVRNYMTKFVKDRWMVIRDLMPDQALDHPWWWNVKVSALGLKAPLTVTTATTCQQAVSVMKENGFDQLPVVEEAGGIKGVVTMDALVPRLISSKAMLTTPVDKVVIRQFNKVKSDTNLGRVSQMLDGDHFVLVLHTQRNSSGDDADNREVVSGIVTPVDLFNYITETEKKGLPSEASNGRMPLD